MVLSHDYARHVTKGWLYFVMLLRWDPYFNYCYFLKGIHFIWLQLIAVGLGSVYFHATLTLAGQLMDELFILWVLMTSYTILFPEKYLSSYLKKNR